LKFRTAILRSDINFSRLKRDLNTNVDVVVTTPGIFHKLHGRDSDYIKHKHVYFTDIQYVVIDEADTLFGGNFKQEIIEQVIIPCKVCR
jgi:superfamily II DNA/RNA helicase